MKWSELECTEPTNPTTATTLTLAPWGRAIVSSKRRKTTDDTDSILLSIGKMNQGGVLLF